jgi:acetyl-CoA acetyltransferase
MHDFGTTPEQLARIAVQCRANAAPNPDARFRDPITIDEVLASPMIASPLHRLDCCIVSDSGGAFVMTSKSRAEQLARKPVYLLGFGEALGQLSMSQMWPFTETAAVHSGARAFASAGLRPSDIDVAQIYDSFTITVLLTLESLGFCRKGEGGEYVEAGTLSYNTDGGGLSSNHPGRRGVFAMIEGVRQLRGTSPGVQLADPKTCLVNGTGGSLSATATMILGV